MRTALFPGSFDPVTNGHLDVIERASSLFDKIFVAIAINSEKNPLFSFDERKALLEEVCSRFDNVVVDAFDGLLVDAARKFDVSAVIRGLRAISDFEYEFQMAMMNRALSEKCETIFLMPKPAYSFLSSRMIKEIAMFGGDVSPFVPPAVAEALGRKKANLQ
ncbi:MAG: pantetheine-phosphate adenylyltransferase [Kiritimatiellaeota bacterium]|nr:pantetheine-phosphate adenylyltransferase [Kiritimatiellota bacterium]